MKMECIKVEKYGGGWKFTFECVEKEQCPKFMDPLNLWHEKPSAWPPGEVFEMEPPKN